MKIEHTLSERVFCKINPFLVPHRCSVPNCPGDLNRRKLELWEEMMGALGMALEWIDAVPSKTPLPSMPGFDRDMIDDLISKAKALK